ncbi:MAG TPA: hypothetical protein VK633_00830 [Verrucomicrobiae bacterium]|nr:hypothetical protein [Verrucomicrobiae bacterium]
MPWRLERRRGAGDLVELARGEDRGLFDAVFGNRGKEDGADGSYGVPLLSIEHRVS